MSGLTSRLGTAGGNLVAVTSRIGLRAVTVLLLMGAVLAFVLTSCPANRDGIPGQLASAKEDTQSAARSAALALDLWARDRSSRQLVGVQVADARDEVAKAYESIAVLQAENPDDVNRQAMLTHAMASVITLLNRSEAAVRGLPSGDPAQLGRTLAENADALERDYR